MKNETAAQERRAQAVAELQSSTMYELLGGEAGIRALVDRFYEVMDVDESFALIRRMHKADLSPMRLSLFEYLSGWLDGPQLFVQRHGSPCLTGAHAPYRIDQDARDLWLACMSRAMVDVGVAERYRELLTPAFGSMADSVRNAEPARTTDEPAVSVGPIRRRAQ
jgi:hemoglobin